MPYDTRILISGLPSVADLNSAYATALGSGHLVNNWGPELKRVEQSAASETVASMSGVQLIAPFPGCADLNFLAKSFGDTPDPRSIQKQKGPAESWQDASVLLGLAKHCAEVLTPDSKLGWARLTDGDDKMVAEITNVEKKFFDKFTLLCGRAPGLMLPLKGLGGSWGGRGKAFDPATASYVRKFISGWGAHLMQHSRDRLKAKGGLAETKLRRKMMSAPLGTNVGCPFFSSDTEAHYICTLLGNALHRFLLTKGFDAFMEARARVFYELGSARFPYGPESLKQPLTTVFSRFGQSKGAATIAGVGPWPMPADCEAAGLAPNPFFDGLSQPEIAYPIMQAAGLDARVRLVFAKNVIDNTVLRLGMHDTAVAHEASLYYHVGGDIHEEGGARYAAQMAYDKGWALVGDDVSAFDMNVSADMFEAERPVYEDRFMATPGITQFLEAIDNEAFLGAPCAAGCIGAIYPHHSGLASGIFPTKWRGCVINTASVAYCLSRSAFERRGSRWVPLDPLKALIEGTIVLTQSSDDTRLCISPTVHVDEEAYIGAGQDIGTERRLEAGAIYLRTTHAKYGSTRVLGSWFQGMFAPERKKTGLDTPAGMLGFIGRSAPLAGMHPFVQHPGWQPMCELLQPLGLLPPPHIMNDLFRPGRILDIMQMLANTARQLAETGGALDEEAIDALRLAGELGLVDPDEADAIIGTTRLDVSALLRTPAATYNLDELLTRSVRAARHWTKHPESLWPSPLL